MSRLSDSEIVNLGKRRESTFEEDNNGNNVIILMTQNGTVADNS